MRLHMGPPPHDESFDPVGDGWNPLREPTPIMLQVVAAPIAVATAVLLFAAWVGLTPLESTSFQITVISASTGNQAGLTPGTALTRIVGGFCLLILAHEILHALAMPKMGFTRNTLIGLWPSRLLFYAAHLGPLARDRFVFVFLIPFLVLTIAPLAACSLAQLQSTLAATVSIVNGACACGDLVGAGMIVWQVPRHSIVRNQGWQTWWNAGIRNAGIRAD